MLVNHHNLEIAHHCAKEPCKYKGETYRIDQLWLTKTGTLAIGGDKTTAVYSVEVSALSAPPSADTGMIDPKSLQTAEEKFSGKVTLVPHLRAQVPKFKPEAKPTLFEATLNAEILYKIAQSLNSFDPNGVVRIRFTGQNDAVLIDAVNVETKQTMMIHLMPRIPGNEKDAERFDRCGQLSEGAASQCVLPAGHAEQRHEMGDLPVEEEDELTKAMRLAELLG